jgi:ribosomal protein S3AE
MAEKTTKIVIKRKKFQPVEIPMIRTKIELIGNTIEDLKDRTIKLDLTRQLKGKSVEAIVQIKIEDEKAVAYPKKIRLMPYFIKRMIRKRISYVEDSFQTPSKESIIIIKPFLITRKKVSRAVRKALRNRCKNWIEDYISEKTDEELFNEVL